MNRVGARIHICRASVLAAGACALIALCWTSGAHAAGSLSWRGGPDIDPAASMTNPVIGLSCTRQRFCLALDSAGRTFVWDGAWRDAPSASRSVRLLTALSCVSKTFCVAIGTSASASRSTSFAVTWTGKGWRAPVKLYSGSGMAALYGTVRAVSCASRSFCIAVGGQVGSSVFNGSRWRERPGATSGTDGQGVVACASSEFCVSVHDANANYWNGSAWRFAANSSLSSGAIAGVNGFVYGLTCVSASFCVAADRGGAPLVWNGSAWRSTTVAPHDPDGFASVSCVTVRFCAAGGISGRLATWDGLRWNVSRSLRLPAAQVLVSCRSSVACIAISSDGKTAETTAA